MKVHGKICEIFHGHSIGFHGDSMDYGILYEIPRNTTFSMVTPRSISYGITPSIHGKFHVSPRNCVGYTTVAGSPTSV